MKLEKPPSATHLIASATATEQQVEYYSQGVLERSQGLEGLTDIRGVGSSSLDKFKEAGYVDIQGVAEASVDELESVSGIGASTAETIAERLADFGEGSTDRCCFCGFEGPGVPFEEVKSKYFTDGELVQFSTGHVCMACAYCMDQKQFKLGHWIATADRYVEVETANLQEELQKVAEGGYEPPFAVHVSKGPGRAEHAYLWTPVSYSTEPFTLDYSRSTLRIEWGDFQNLIDVVELLRWHSYRLDDIREGTPRSYSLKQLGFENAKKLDGVIEEYRGTDYLELAIGCSRSENDQDRTQDEIQELLKKYT